MIYTNSWNNFGYILFVAPNIVKRDKKIYLTLALYKYLINILVFLFYI